MFIRNLSCVLALCSAVVVFNGSVRGADESVSTGFFGLENNQDAKKPTDVSKSVEEIPIPSVTTEQNVAPAPAGSKGWFRGSGGGQRSTDPIQIDPPSHPGLVDHGFTVPGHSHNNSTGFDLPIGLPAMEGRQPFGQPDFGQPTMESQPATGQLLEPRPNFSGEVVEKFQAPMVGVTNPGGATILEGSPIGPSPYISNVGGVQPGGLVIGSNTVTAAGAGLSGYVRLDTGISRPMLDLLNRQSNKETLILQHAQQTPGPGLVLGAQFRPTVLLSETNTENSFSYLGRFPPDFTGTTATDARILQANQSGTAHFNSWVHGYFETLFSDAFSFATFDQGSFQVRQAFVVLGDLNKSPFYAFLGKKNVTFGDFRTLSPFTQAVPWHYFAPLAEGAGVGFNGGGFNVSVMGINGGRGIRVADSGSIGRINNFAANAHYQASLGTDFDGGIGVGYLHGTIYDTAVPEHIDPTAFGPRNSAIDINAQLRWRFLSFAGEFVQTTEPWPATDEQVTAFQLEAAADFYIAQFPTRASFSFSEGRQGPTGSQFEFNRQMVAGLRFNATPNIALTAEYVRSSGFAPLINITTVSNRDVVQNSIVLGMNIAM